MRNRVLSRRERALRSALVVAGIFLGVHILGIYHHTPAAAQREMERRMGLRDCEELASHWSWNRDGLQLSTRSVLTRITLTANDEALMLTRQDYHPMKGWSAEVMTWLPLEKGEALWLDVAQRGQKDRIDEIMSGMYFPSNDKSHGKIGDCWIYGTVSDPNMTQLNLRARHERWAKTVYTDGVLVDDELQDTTVTVTEFIEVQDQRIFFQPIKIPADREIQSVWLVTEQGETLVYGKES